MEKSVLFTQNQKWDSNLDCEFQVSVQAANKWHIMNNLGRSLTVLAVPWILSAALLSATLALVYKHYWHFGIPNFYFFLFFFSLSRMSHAFVKVWHISTLQSSQMLPIYFHSWVITSPSVGAWRSEDLSAAAKVVLFLAQGWKCDILCLPSSAFVSSFPKDMALVKRTLVMKVRNHY